MIDYGLLLRISYANEGDLESVMITILSDIFMKSHKESN